MAALLRMTHEPPSKIRGAPSKNHCSAACDPYTLTPKHDWVLGLGFRV